jgi:hypothetical protein
MLPHLLVPEMAEAIVAATARRVLVLNLVAQPGETTGFAPETHLEALARHAPQLRFDTVIADPHAVPDPAALRQASASLGARLQLSPVSVADGPRHDPVRLAEAFREAFSSVPPVGSVDEDLRSDLHKSAGDAYRSVPSHLAAEGRILPGADPPPG